MCKQEPIKYEGFKDDKHRFAINICDYEAAGRNVEVKLYVYVTNHIYENLQLIHTDQILKINDMPTNEQRRSQYNFWTTIPNPNFIFYLLGTYTNSIGKRKYQIDEMYGFEMNPFNNGYLHERTKQKVLSQIKF